MIRGACPSTTEGAGGGAGDSATGLRDAPLDGAFFTVALAGVVGIFERFEVGTLGVRTGLRTSMRGAAAGFAAALAAGFLTTTRGLSPMPFMIWLGVALQGPHQQIVRPAWNVDHVPGWPQQPACQV